MTYLQNTSPRTSYRLAAEARDEVKQFPLLLWPASASVLSQGRRQTLGGPPTSQRRTTRAPNLWKLELQGLPKDFLRVRRENWHKQTDGFAGRGRGERDDR